MAQSHEEFVKSYNYTRRRRRIAVFLTFLLLLGMYLLSLCFRLVKPQFIPLEGVKNFIYFIRLQISYLTGSSYALGADAIIDSLPYYGETSQRVYISFFTMFSGMALGLSGAVFQQIYKNPVASPATIGATAGVNLGNMLLVLLYSYTAIEMILYRYLFCLGISFGIMLLISGLCRIYGFRMGNYPVIEMLMVGSILSRMITSFTTYMMYQLNGSALIAYQEMNLGVYQVFSLKSILLFLGILITGIFLILSMRNRINATAFDSLEMKAAGINVEREQFIARFLATAIVGVACIQCGDVGIFTLAVPHVVRYAVGSDFRKLAIYSTLWGGIFLLILRMISSVVFLGPEPIPLNFIVSTIMLPIFLIMLALQRRGFE